MIYFDTIEGFINYKQNCVLCDDKLVPRLCKTVQSNISGKELLKINGKYKRGSFSFKMKNHHQGKADMLGFINCQTNEIKYRYEDSEDFIEDFVVQSLISNVLSKSYPHIELTCENKDCNSYYISSSSLVIAPDKIAKLELSWESFNVNSSWVQNDWTENKTKIYSTENTEANPIILDLIQFDSMPKEKLFKKIKTIVTFS